MDSCSTRLELTDLSESTLSETIRIILKYKSCCQISVEIQYEAFLQNDGEHGAIAARYMAYTDLVSVNKLFSKSCRTSDVYCDLLHY